MEEVARARSPFDLAQVQSGRLYYNSYFRFVLWLFIIFRNQNAHKEKNEL